ncbi:MAG: LPP20 family lipoprotein [Helicobacteraceae bacterium]|jgi:hypothetical protein|nr:LPP20 family lipoprotein [Helicobacteraceae bacterium]
MRFAIIAILAIVGIGLVSCAHKTSAVAAPQWINGASGYEPSRYITGIGSGVNRDIAADRARNDLAKTIGVNIESLERSRVSGGSSGYENVFSSAVNVHVSQTVGGVEIADRYYDEDNNVYYALAVLDRAKNAMNLSAELWQKELALEALLNEASKETDALEKLRVLSKTTALLNDRRSIAALLSVIDAMPPPPFNAERDIEAQRRAALRTIKISVGGDYEGKKMLTEALADAGFTLIDQTKSDYQAIGYYKNEVGLDNGWQWATATLETEIVDYDDGSTRRFFSFVAKESSQNAETAKERARRKLREELGEKFFNAVVFHDER